MNPIRAILFNAAGIAWAEVHQLPEHIPEMLSPGDLGWVRNGRRYTDAGTPTDLADLGAFSVDPDTCEILLESP